MKDWHIPLTELTNGQVANLFYLANLAGLKVCPIRGITQTNIGAHRGDFSLWLLIDGKQITYKKAVKKLHKLIDENNKPLTKIKIGGCEFEAHLSDFAYLSDFAGSVEHSAGDEVSMITACSGGGGASYLSDFDTSGRGKKKRSIDLSGCGFMPNPEPAQAISELSFTPTKEGAYKVHFTNDSVSVSYEGEE